MPAVLEDPPAELDELLEVLRERLLGLGGDQEVARTLLDGSCILA
jgi:hypothetical protein